MCKVKCSTIKQFIWDRDLILPGYDIVLDNGDVVRDSELFHTLADARSKVIEELKFFIANDKKMVMGLQREIAIFERRLATLKSLDEKKRNQSNPPQ